RITRITRIESVKSVQSVANFFWFVTTYCTGCPPTRWLTSRYAPPQCRSEFVQARRWRYPRRSARTSWNSSWGRREAGENIPHQRDPAGQRELSSCQRCIDQSHAEVPA